MLHIGFLMCQLYRGRLVVTFLLLALSKDFGSLASWMSGMSHEPAHSSTAFPLSSVVVITP